MKNRLPLIAVLFVLAVMVGCKKNNQVNVPDPSAATLTYPAQNSACTTGTIISTTQSTIVFTWNSAGNADSYEIDIKNLLTGSVSTQTVAINQYTATLLRDTPYSWYVVSKSNLSAVKNTSAIWKFYNAGTGTISHPPFPADALSPAFAQNVSAAAGTVKLSWTGVDPDSDITGFDIYFGTSTIPTLSKANVTDMFLNGVTVTSGVTYYWKIITKDSQGNTSDSGTFQFKVN